MDGDKPKGRVIPFPSPGKENRREDLEAFEAWLTSHPAYRKAQAALAADANAPPDPNDATSHAPSMHDVWEVLDATVMSVAPEYFEAYRHEIEFRRRFGFDLGRRERAGVLLFKYDTGLTDRDIRLLGRTSNLRFGASVTVSASRGQAAYGYALMAVAGVLMLLGLLAAASPAGQSLRGALIVVPYEAVLVGFCWGFMQMYLRPYTLRRRVESLLDARKARTATSAQTASSSHVGA